jgi:hypothetical protein
MAGYGKRKSFDASQDLILKAWKNEEIGIVAGIYSYKNGPPKFQIGPRLQWKKNAEGELYPITLRIGRLHKEDLVWINDIMPEVLEAFDELKEVLFVEGTFKNGVGIGNDINDLTPIVGVAEETGNNQ